MTSLVDGVEGADVHTVSTHRPLDSIALSNRPLPTSQSTHTELGVGHCLRNDSALASHTSDRRASSGAGHTGRLASCHPQ